MAYEKTTNLQLSKIADDNIFDVSIITENFEKVDDAFGKIKPDTNDTDVTCTGRGNKKLNEVLTTDVAIRGEILPQDIKGNTDKRIYKYVRIADENTDRPYLWVEYVNSEGKSVTTFHRFADMKFFSDIRNGINNLKLSDTNITSEINALKVEGTNMLALIEQYKASVDEYSQQLGVYVERHRVANNELNTILGG